MIRREMNNFIVGMGVPRFIIKRDILAFSNIIGKINRILDIGGGSFLPYKNLFDVKHYFGLDLYDPAHVIGDANKLPISSEGLDAILCTEVLEHVTDPIKTLQEIHRCLKIEGYLILTVPFVWGVHEEVDNHRWTDQGLKNILVSNGFEIKEFRKRGGVFSLLGLLIFVIPRLIIGNSKNLIIMLLKLITFPFFWIFQWLLYPLDILDKKRDFVHGYDVLCVKR